MAINTNFFKFGFVHIFQTQTSNWLFCICLQQRKKNTRNFYWGQAPWTLPSRRKIYVLDFFYLTSIMNQYFEQWILMKAKTNRTNLKRKMSVFIVHVDSFICRSHYQFNCNKSLFYIVIKKSKWEYICRVSWSCRTTYFQKNYCILSNRRWGFGALCIICDLHSIQTKRNGAHSA